ncbi:MAG TPA: hypothetical protein VFG21_01715 [Xanthomonadaceae bacterium]|nr:hypothetical protein [Xanthomonadaceae bacterium]
MQAFDAFLGNWRAREPEMEFAEVFCAPSDRARFRWWGVLLNELLESLHAPSEPAVAQARLQWWLAELRGAARQHPVSAMAHECGVGAAPVAEVALAALQLTGEGRAPRTLADAMASMDPLAAAIARAEQQLFDPSVPAPQLQIAASLVARAAFDAGAGRPLGRERMPLDLLARWPLTEPDDASALHRELAVQLLATAGAGASGGVLFRRARTGFDRWRLGRWKAGAPAGRVPPLRALWIAHGAARGAPRP